MKLTHTLSLSSIGSSALAKVLIFTGVCHHRTGVRSFLCILCRALSWRCTRCMQFHSAQLHHPVTFVNMRNRMRRTGTLVLTTPLGCFCRYCRLSQHAAHQDALLHITPQAELLCCHPQGAGGHRHRVVETAPQQGQSSGLC